MPIASLSLPSLGHCCQKSPPFSLKSSFLSKPTKTLFSFALKTTLKWFFSHIVSMCMETGIGVMGTKLGMMSYFETDGTVVPVTVVGFRVGNIVTQVKNITELAVHVLVQESAWKSFFVNGTDCTCLDGTHAYESSLSILRTQ